MSIGRDGVGLCVLGNKLMAVGGYDGTQYLDLVEAFDPISNTWTQVWAIFISFRLDTPLIPRDMQIIHVSRYKKYQK
jgi:Kelch motif